MNISKIINIKPEGSFETKYGLMHKFAYTLEDGTVGESNHKTEESPFKPGQSVWYEITGKYKGINKLKLWGKQPQEQAAKQSAQQTEDNQPAEKDAPDNNQPRVVHSGQTIGLAVKLAAEDARIRAGDIDTAKLENFLTNRARLYLRVCERLASSDNNDMDSNKDGDNIPF